MKLDAQKSEYTLESTGRKVAANFGVMGLTPRLQLTEGYDAVVSSLDDSLPLTIAEKAEIADEMIGRWTVWKRLEPIITGF